MPSNWLQASSFGSLLLLERSLGNKRTSARGVRRRGGETQLSLPLPSLTLADRKPEYSLEQNMERLEGGERGAEPFYY